MSFTDEQKAELAAKLDGSLVKTRKQAGQTLSYIEGWQVIAEANRIFGFDGWTRETVLAECVHSGEYQKPLWENGRKTDRTTAAFRCTYVARVRVTAGGIFRDGTGSGHGFGENPGDAHESAIKEAETDAMKRALMTFGNPFGLALYDKSQSEVEWEAPAKPAQRASGAGPSQVTPPASAPQASPGAPRDRAVEQFFKRDNYEIPVAGIKWPEWREKYLKALYCCRSAGELSKLEQDNAPHMKHYTTIAKPDDIESFRVAITDTAHRLRQQLVA